MATCGDAVPSVVGGILVGQLCNLLLLACARVSEMSEFTWTVFIPTVRICVSVILAYWVWQETNVCPHRSASCVAAMLHVQSGFLISILPLYILGHVA
jgi:hypothetical protein